jgi:pimeloyl-ACP methyl ester carboxylesterase
VRLRREGGVELHWEQRGEGPLVVIACQWSGHPPVFEPLIEELENDHRIVTYDARGTGRSTRRGPHDMSTGAADLCAVIEAAGGPAVIVTLAEACNRAVRVGANRPDLVAGIVAPGTLPVRRSALAGTQALVTSDAVVDAFLEMLANDYRGAQRTMMTTSNPQMNEEEVRERVNSQVAYCPADVALKRTKVWRDDDPADFARACGDRLWLLWSPDMVGPWFPPVQEVSQVLSRELPEARLEEVKNGLISRPDLTAGVVRLVTDAVRRSARADMADRRGVS